VKLYETAIELCDWARVQLMFNCPWLLYFLMSSQTFLLLVLLAHRVRLRLLQLMRYMNYLRAYLLTVINWSCMCVLCWQKSVLLIAA